MNNKYINKVIHNDCTKIIPQLKDESIDLFLSDIPYGIALDDWDVLHNNTNSALLGSSPAQEGKSGFKRRGKPINGWSQSDRNIGKEYQEWCDAWASDLFPKMKAGSSIFVFGARRTIHRVVNAFEDNGFLTKDILAWKKSSAHHRAQRVSIILNKRGLDEEAKKWDGWRLGNLAPIYEPIAWFMKPYKIGSTITDNILENQLGAMNIDACLVDGLKSPTNLLEFSFNKSEKKVHEAQKPIELMEYLIKLTTIEGQVVLDPFVGSGTTAEAAVKLKRDFIAIESNKDYHEYASARVNAAKSRNVSLFDCK